MSSSALRRTESAGVSGCSCRPALPTPVPASHLLLFHSLLPPSSMSPHTSVHFEPAPLSSSIPSSPSASHPLFLPPIRPSHPRRPRSALPCPSPRPSHRPAQALSRERDQGFAHNNAVAMGTSCLATLPRKGKFPSSAYGPAENGRGGIQQGTDQSGARLSARAQEAAQAH